MKIKFNVKVLTITYIVLAMTIFNSCDRANKKGENKNFNYIGQSQIEIKDGILSPEILLHFGKVSDPQLSPDKQYILYNVKYTSLEQNRSCSNLFLCNIKGNNKVQLTKEAHSISNARWSKNGSKIYYLKEGQLYFARFNSKKLSLSKGKQISNIKEGIQEFKLSPDQSKIIFTSTCKGPVQTPTDLYPDMNKAEAYICNDLMYRHWDSWVTSINQAYVAPFSGERESLFSVPKLDDIMSKNILATDAKKYELPLSPFNGIEQLCFSSDSRYIAYSCKKLQGKEYAFSTDSEIYLYDTESEQTTLIPMKGGYDSDPIWSPNGKHLAWLSMERNGYEADKSRLMLANIINDNGVLRAEKITDVSASFKYNVASPIWSEDGKKIYFSALAEGLGALFYYSLDGNNKGEIKRLTAENEDCDYYSPFAISDDGKNIFTSYCSMDFPKELVCLNLNDDSKINLSKENDHILSQLKEHKTEARQIKTVDGKDMLTWVVYPPDFDENKKYPAILITLGGPQGTLSQNWSYRWNYRLMSAQGYVVILPNRRGTTAFGQEWTEQISGDYIGLNMQDYLTAARELKKEKYIGKMAACGASYGGYSVYYLAGIHNGVFDCFVAHAGIFDEKYMYYETEEMWFPNWDNGGLTEYAYEKGQMGPKGDGITFGGMQQAGSPWSNLPKPKRHYANSPADNITKWNTPILCIHGCLDFRIPYDQGMAAFNCAQMMGVPSRLIIFPNENHWILKAQNSLLWHREFFKWLDQWCK